MEISNSTLKPMYASHVPTTYVSSLSGNCIQLCSTMVKTSLILNLNMKIHWKLIFCPLQTHEHLAKFLTIIHFPILCSLLMSFHSEHLLSPLKMCHKTYLSTFTICQGWPIPQLLSPPHNKPELLQHIQILHPQCRSTKHPE